LRAAVSFKPLHQCGIFECAGDAKITADVEARFREHAAIQPRSAIYVSTFNGVVYLGGAVDSPSAKAEAELLAREIPGVTDVVSSIVGMVTE
jgi:osmotically-inducible protein OsmY